MVKVIIAAACGKMGQEILNIALEDPEIEVAGVFERPDHPRIGEEIAKGLLLASRVSEVIDAGDVLIDFSHHTASIEHARVVAERNKRGVVGTTGFSPEELKEIKSLAHRSPFVVAPNMSVGINLMFKLVKEMATVLGPAYDIEIIEAHHRMKKDAPSGTALRLGEIMAEAGNATLKEVGVFARHGMIGVRTDREIGLQTIRAGDIVGEHTVLFAAPGERLELTHRVGNRANFARGAIKAAHWIVHQGAGFYDMQDVLRLK